MIFPSLKGIKNANGAHAFSWVIGVGRPAVFTRALDGVHADKQARLCDSCSKRSSR